MKHLCYGFCWGYEASAWYMASLQCNQNHIQEWCFCYLQQHDQLSKWSFTINVGMNHVCLNIGSMWCALWMVIDLHGYMLTICKQAKWMYILLHNENITWIMWKHNILLSILAFLWATMLIPRLWVLENHGHYLPTFFSKEWC